MKKYSKWINKFLYFLSQRGIYCSDYVEKYYKKYHFALNTKLPMILNNQFTFSRINIYMYVRNTSHPTEF